ncbi:MAG: HAMP domain-containing histidine kinase [Clostridiales bacterium]|nr:HAMP domain-containing histidine kinase [Clostridiales bacterium]
MRKIKEKFKNLGMALKLAFFVFVIYLAAIAVAFFLVLLVSRTGIFSEPLDFRIPLFQFAVVSLIVGTILSAVFGRMLLKPLRKVMDAADRIADGDYSVRISLKGSSELTALGERFNHMARELDSVEMLRQDFVNNFSHEFKTPIVSIRGFAKMLKLEDISEQERTEYLTIIISESERLSELAVNVLELSKLEQQAILSERQRFNLSEQIRLAIIMMDQKWADRKTEYQLEGEEIFLEGNQDLLKQVWINLLDNAVKFSPLHGTVRILIQQVGKTVSISVANQGDAIPLNAAAHIFDKFYQGDTSHSTKGNGLGLSIAKQVVKLHGGQIFLKSSDGEWTVFEVILPKAQLPG